MTPSETSADLSTEIRLALSRRRFLRGVGACMALPALESLVSERVLAAAARASGSLAVSKSGMPMRMAFVYFPNGANQPCWWPKGEGTDFELNRTMKPLEPLKSKIQVLGGLDNLSANAGKDGGGDHARASSTFLTGVRIKKTSGADIRAGVSIDHLAAQRIGHLTRFPSLELTCDGVRKSGSCDTGYSCAYDWNMSWRTPNTPMAPEPNPRMVFERLFGSGSPGERQRNFAQRQERQKSILDAVMEDARDLQIQLAARDLNKLDEYLTGVREIEARVQQCERLGESPDPAVETPAGIPSSHREHVRLMFDMMSLAFRTDSTRIVTLILAHDGSNRAFPEIGIPEGHHSLSHHRGKKDNLEKVAQIDLFYMEEYARFLRGLDDAKEADGTSVLDNSMIVYGCGNGDGNRHNHDNLPIVLAGGAGGTFSAGRFVKHRSQPLASLYLSMADRLGISDLKSFGDSAGPLGNV
jgi:hypothetical protein